MTAAPPETATRTRMWAAPYRTTTVGLLLVVTLPAFEAMAVGTVMPVAARDLNGLSLYAWAFSSVFILGLVGNVVAAGLTCTAVIAAIGALATHRVRNNDA